jgi:hypothetical protein
MQTNQLKQKDPKEWSFVLCTQEITSKTSQHIVDVIKERFSEIVELQMVKNPKLKKPSSIFDFNYISFDWTNANTGIKNGIAAILNRERKEKNVAEMIVVGCADHSCNIICKNFNESKKSMFFDFKGFKMECYQNMKSLYKYICRNKNYFNGFLKKEFPQKHGVGNLGKTSDTRFGSYYVVASKFLDNREIFESFCEKTFVAHAFDREEFFSENSQEELFTMERAANVFMLPYMKHANEIKSTKEYANFNQEWITKMENSLQNQEDFFGLWEIDDQNERYGPYQELFISKKSKLEKYLRSILDLDVSSGRKRSKLCGKYFSSYFKKESFSHHTFSFCLLIEFACEVIFSLKQRNVDYSTLEDQAIHNATNRSGERVNAQVRKLFLKNPKTNLAVIESSLKVNRLLFNFTMISHVFTKYKEKKWWCQLFKRGNNSLKTRARERISKNKIITFQMEKYENDKNKHEISFREEEAKRFAKKILEKLNEMLKNDSNEISPSMPSSIPEEEEVIDDESSSFHEEFDIPLASFEYLVEKTVKRKDIVDCLEFFTNKKYTQKKEELVCIFIKKSKKFLLNPSLNPCKLQKEKPISHKELAKQNWEKWIKNDQRIKEEDKSEERLTQILNSTDGTLLGFAVAKNKWEYVKSLNKKFKLNYKKKDITV